jgi:hypothetical protein
MRVIAQRLGLAGRREFVGLLLEALQQTTSPRFDPGTVGGDISGAVLLRLLQFGNRLANLLLADRRKFIPVIVQSDDHQTESRLDVLAEPL